MSDRIKIIDTAETKAFLIKNFLSIFYNVESEKITLITNHFKKEFNKSEFYHSSKSFGFNQFSTVLASSVSSDSSSFSNIDYSSIEERKLLYFMVNKRNSYHYEESVRNTPFEQIQRESFALPEKTYQKLYRFFYKIYHAFNTSQFFFHKASFIKENEEWFIEILNIKDKVLDVCRTNKVVVVFTTNYIFHFLPRIWTMKTVSKVKNIYFLSYSGGRNDFYDLKIQLGL